MKKIMDFVNVMNDIIEKYYSLIIIIPFSVVMGWFIVLGWCIRFDI